MAKRQNARAVAARLSWQIIDKGQSLDAALGSHFEELPDDDRGLIQELVYGCCRWYGELDWIAGQLLAKPVRNKDRVVHFALLIGLYQLKHLNTADHAAVSETVAACQQLNKGWAKNMVNGCLRRWQREAQQLQAAEETLHELNHPPWMVAAIKQNWPHQASDILRANDQRPPMMLRVNRRLVSTADYLQLLNAANIAALPDPRSSDAICLQTAVPVSQLPHFGDGFVSVQDIAAQIAADVLRPELHSHILDACAAPGGKAAHLLERSDNNLHLDALDISAARVLRLKETFQRLRLRANVYVADATQNPVWPVPSEGYDQILIDAPCSGTGVIRRHPDIKHHRRVSDIPALTKIQAQLLNKLWQLLKPGGELLYITCSILTEENEEQIVRFLSSHSDAEVQKISHPESETLSHGCQTLPGVHDMDGFYMCLLRKMKA